MELLEDNPWIKNSIPLTIEEAVTKSLQPDGCGAIELAMNHGVKIGDFIGRLVWKLHERGIIDDEFVLDLMLEFKEYKGAPDDGH